MDGGHDKALLPVTEVEEQKRQPKQVLEEEDYVEKLEAIIERNYFPELPQLRADLGVESKPLPDASTLPKTIGKFLSKFTSEDNESFEQLVEANDVKHRSQNPWLYKDERSLCEGSKQQLALPSIEKQAAIESSNKSSTTIAWPYKNKNSLMYYPEGAKQQLKPGSSVALENTRLSQDLLDKQASALPAVSSNEESLDINGYYLIPPTPTPQVSSTPLHPSTPQFRLPEVSSREQLALSLAEERSKKKMRRESANTPVHSPFYKVSRLSQLSPAAQLLSRKSFPSSDPELLASYTPKLGSFTPTPRSSASIVTPDLQTLVRKKKKNN